MKAHFSVESVIQNLKDAACDEATIEIIMSELQGGNQIKATQLLQKHRRNLLSDLHNDQKRIDCLDYFIFTLQKSTNNNN